MLACLVLLPGHNKIDIVSYISSRYIYNLNYSSTKQAMNWLQLVSINSDKSVQQWTSLGKDVTSNYDAGDYNCSVFTYI